MIFKKKKQSGFTLIELLVVVVIIGILASVAVPNFMGAQDKAKNSGVQSNAHGVQMALEQYGVDNGGQYPDNLNSVSANSAYMNGFPKTPWNTQQASNAANITIPTVAVNAAIAAGTNAAPSANTHYGAICYIKSGTANDKYELSGVGKQGDKAQHVFNKKNY